MNLNPSPTSLGDGTDALSTPVSGAKAAQTSDAAADKAAAKVSYGFRGDRGGKPTSNRLSYPHDKVYSDHTDYVKFKFVEYNPPFASLAGTEFLDKDGKNVKKDLTGDQALNLYNNSIGEFIDAKLPTIMMYMPEDMGAAYGAQWGGKGFTNFGSDAMRAAGGVLNSGGFAQTAGTAVQALGNTMTRGQALAASALAGALNNLPGKIGGSVTTNDVLGGVGGVILNPNAELLFSGFELRNFGLNFKMAPRNQQEALVIRDICTTFKRASLPHFGAAPGNTIANAFKGKKGTAEKNDNRNYIGVPNLCIVEFMKGGQPHPYLTQYKPCAIREVNITYTPDGQYSTYSDGSPVATGLTLSFIESKLVYSNEISYGGTSY